MKAIILAGGKGSRLSVDGNDTAKVLRTVLGKPLIEYMLNTLGFVEQKDITIVVGYKKEQIMAKFEGYSFAVQQQQLGTGDAVKAAMETLSDYTGDIVVCYGDMPLYKRDTFEKMVEYHSIQNNDCTILDGVTDEKLAYGRIITDSKNEFIDIIEEKDCTDKQLKIKHLNVGAYVFKADYLRKALKMLNNNNAQHEYYLTDIPKIIKANGGKTGIFVFDDSTQMLGVNTIDELLKAENLLSNRCKNA